MRSINVVLFIFCIFVAKCAGKDLKAGVMYNWKSLDYKWNSELERSTAIANGSFIVQNNLMAGIKVFKGRVFVTVPRWRDGVPSTLNEVVQSDVRGHVLKPFPDWSWQTIGDCDVLQYVQSMEIDPNTGYMWIIDVGRINIFDVSRNVCPAKLIVMDIANGKVILKYEFPDSVVSRNTNFLNDLLLDYVNGEVSHVFISDTGDAKIVVFDVNSNASYFLFDKSLLAEDGNTGVITFSNHSRKFTTPVDGIAMSPDFRYVFYCPLAGVHLYRVPTHVLRQRNSFVFSANVQNVGKRSSQADGMIFSRNSLYYGGLSTNSIYRVRYQNLLTNTNTGNSALVGEDKILTDNLTLRWPDTFSIDEDGNLWAIANTLLLSKRNGFQFKHAQCEYMESRHK